MSDACHFCGVVDQSVELCIFDTQVGAFQVPCCVVCAYYPPRLSCPEAVRLAMDHPADEAGAHR